MSRITLVRKEHRSFTQRERELAWQVVTSMMDGYTEADKRAWRGLWGRWRDMPAGDMAEVGVFVERYPPAHRRHMAIEGAIFEAQEQCIHRKVFRDWLKTGAGFVNFEASDGALVAVPRSTAYDELDELEMRAFTRDMVDFLRTPDAMRTLWPTVSERGQREIMSGILDRFEKEGS